MLGTELPTLISTYTVHNDFKMFSGNTTLPVTSDGKGIIKASSPISVSVYVSSGLVMQEGNAAVPFLTSCTS